MPEQSIYRQRVYDVYVDTTSSRGMGQIGLDAQARQYHQRWSQFLPNDQESANLDLGCGTGEFIYYFQQYGYQNVYGIEVSAQQIKVARSIGACHVEVGDGLTYLLDHPGAFKLINTQNLLEHLKRGELIEWLDAIHDALQPDGTLFVIVPNAASPWGTRTRYWDIIHEISFTPSSITQMLLVSGYNDINILEYGPVVHCVKSAMHMIVWQLIRMMLRLYLLAEVGNSRDNVFTQDMRVIARKMKKSEDAVFS